MLELKQLQKRSFKTAFDATSRLILIYEDGTPSYVGNAPPGTGTDEPGWQIRRIAVDGNITSMYFANGNADFVNIWDNRASLVYS